MKARTLAAAAILAMAPLAARADHLTEWVFPITVDQTNPPATFAPGAPEPSGLASVLIDSDAMTISWDVDYQDLSGPIIAPGAHFHGPAALGSNAGVEVFLTNGNPSSPATGNLTGSAALNAQQLDDVLSGLWYLNIHTQMNGAGELRGQVLNVIPEPTSVAMLAITGAVLAAARRR